MKTENQGRSVRAAPAKRHFERPLQDRAIRLADGVQTADQTQEKRRPNPAERRPNSLSRKILPALMAIFASFSAHAVLTVTNHAVDIFGSSFDTAYTFTPTNDSLHSQFGLSTGPARTVYSTNGALGLTLVPGPYTVSFPLVSWRKSFEIVVSETSGTAWLTNLMLYPRYLVDTYNLDHRMLILELGQVTNTDSRAMYFTNEDNIFAGTFSGDGSGLDSLPRHLLGTFDTSLFGGQGSAYVKVGTALGGVSLADVTGIVELWVDPNGVHATHYDGDGAALTNITIRSVGSTNFIFTTPETFEQDLATAEFNSQGGAYPVNLHCGPGLYTEHDILRNGVNIFGEPGAYMLWVQTTTNDNGQGIADDRGRGPCTNFIWWPGGFQLVGFTNRDLFTNTAPGDFNWNTINPQTRGTIVLTNPDSRVSGYVSIVRKSVFTGTDTAGGAVDLVNGSSMLSFDLIEDPLSDVVIGLLYPPLFGDDPYDLRQSSATGVYWENGNSFVNFRKIIATQYGVYCNQQNTNSANDFFVNGDYQKGKLYIVAHNLLYRTWFRLQLLEPVSPGATGIGAETIDIFGSGKHYIDVSGKILSGSGSVGACLNTQASPTESNMVVWLHTPKMEAGPGAKWINLNGAGEVHADVKDYTSTSGGSGGFAVTEGAFLDINGGLARTNAFGTILDISGGAADIYGLRATTTNGRAISKSGGSLALQNTSLFSSQNESIYSSTAQGVIFNGNVHFDKPLGSNVTATVNGFYSVGQTNYGNGAGISNVPPSGLLAQGASGGQVLGYTGNIWAPTNPPPSMLGAGGASAGNLLAYSGAAWGKTNAYITNSYVLHLMNGGGAAGISVAGAVTNWIGLLSVSSTTGEAGYTNSRIRIPVTGTLVRVDYLANFTSASASETTTNYIRVNSTHGIAQVLVQYGTVKNETNATCNVAVTAGDFVAFAIANPFTYSAAPTAGKFEALLTIQVPVPITLTP